MESDDNDAAGLFKHVVTLINDLTTDETINDDQRIEILLTELSALIESGHSAYHIGRFITDTFVLRANNVSCPDIELDRTILMIRNTAERYPYPPGSGIVSLGRLVLGLKTRYTKLHNIADLDEALWITRHIFGLDPSLDKSYVNLGAALFMKFQSGTGKEDDLLEAVRLLRRARELVSESEPYWQQCLDNLCAALRIAYKQFSLPEYLEEAIDVQRCFVMVKNDRPTSNSDLSLAARGLKEEDGSPAITLSGLLHDRYELSGNTDDLDEAIRIAATELEVTPPGATRRSTALGRLAYYLQSRVSYSNNLADANAVIEMYREILQIRLSESASESRLPDCLSNLANSLNGRYKIDGDKSSLDEAIGIFREAETITPESHEARSYILHNLADALRERHHATGQDSDLEESMLLLRETLRLRPAGHNLRSSTLHSLSTSLKLKYESLSSSVYHDATTSFWEAFEGYYSGSVPFSPDVFSLGATFRKHFLASKEKAYIDESINCLEEALTIATTSLNRAMILHSLGNSLRSRSTSHFVERQYFLQDLIEMKKKVADTQTPGAYTLNLIISRTETLQRVDSISSSGDLEDINLAISYFAEAIELGNFGILQIYSLMALADCLSTRFHFLGDVSDLHEALRIFNDLLKDSSDYLPVNFPITFAKHLKKMFIATREQHYLEEAVTQYRTAVSLRTITLLKRQNAAQIWAETMDGYHESALEAYRIAIELLPQVAAMSLDMDSRWRALQEAEAERICHNGVGCALQLGRFQDAAEFLEQGRAIYWSQVLQLRSPIEDLQKTAPELARALGSISRQLHLGSLRDSLPNDIHDPQQRRSFERDVANYQVLENEWENVVAEVRSIQGFENFLLPKKVSMLQGVMEPGETIVLLSEAGRFDTCSALLVSRDEIRHIQLSGIDASLLSVIVHMIKHGQNSEDHWRLPATDGGLTEEQVSSRNVEKFMNKYRHGRVKLHEQDNEAKCTCLSIALRWVWDEIAKPIIHALDLEKSDDPPHIWWCPTGPFSFLPLHAAGIYEDEASPDGPECVSDYLISSYIPTLGSLLSQRINSTNRDLRPKDEFEMMVILEPRTLPWAVEELQSIKRHVASNKLSVFGDSPRNPATVETVTSHLPTASIVHFSCHGKQDPVNPLESALVMDNGPLTIRHIMQQPMPHSSLAFLCACETARGTEKLADEAVSLGSSLLYSGFQSIVATMWSIADQDGPTIADYFYGYLFDNEDSNERRLLSSNESQFARALHFSVKGLRNKGVPLERWVPFIHMGM